MRHHVICGETNHSHGACSTASGDGEGRCCARGSVGGEEDCRGERGRGGVGEVKHTEEACPGITGVEWEKVGPSES